MLSLPGFGMVLTLKSILPITKDSPWNGRCWLRWCCWGAGCCWGCFRWRG